MARSLTREPEPRVDPGRVHAVTLAIWLAVIVGIAAIWAFPRFFGALLLMALAVAFYGVLYAVVEQRMLRMERDFVDDLGSKLDDLDDDEEDDEEDSDELDRPRPAPRAKRAPRRKRATAVKPSMAPSSPMPATEVKGDTAPSIAVEPPNAAPVPTPAAEGSGSN